MAENVEHWVYVLAGPDSCGPTKVGISHNVEKRLRSIQTTCPFPLHLIVKYLCPNKEVALTVENCFHVTNSKKRKQGEWFDIRPIPAAQLVAVYYTCFIWDRVPEKFRHLFWKKAGLDRAPDLNNLKTWEDVDALQGDPTVKAQMKGLPLV